MIVNLYLKHFPPLADKLSEGSRKAVHGLATGFVSCGAQVRVLCEGNDDSTFDAPGGYQVLCFAAPKKSYPSFKLAPSLKSHVERGGSDEIFVLNGIFTPRVSSMARLLLKKDIPYIVAPHDPYHPSIFATNSHLKWPYWYMVERHMLRRAKAVQVLDARHAQYLKMLNVQTPAIAAPNGYSPEDVIPESSLTWRTDGEAKFVYLGRMDVHNKGLDLLLEAFALLNASRPARLLLQGPDNSGGKARLQEKMRQLKLEEKVTFLGPDYNQTPPNLIAPHDVFCLPSRFEGFGLSALEAMLSARVLLISDVAGLAPHVARSDCGIVIKPEVASIAEGMTQILSRRDEWKKMGLRGRSYALEHLQWERIARELLEQYLALS